MAWLLKIYMLSYLLIAFGATIEGEQSIPFADRFIFQLWNVGKWYLIGIVVILLSVLAF